MREIALFFLSSSVAYSGCCQQVGGGVLPGRNQNPEMHAVAFDDRDAWRIYRDGLEHDRRDYENVAWVEVRNHKVNADELRTLLAFPSLRYLILGERGEGVELEEHALDVLKAPKLEGLHFCKKDLRDADLSFLPRLQSLKYLTIEIGTDFDVPSKPGELTDQAAAWIAQLSELKELDVLSRFRLKLTDAFIKEVSKLPKLRRLKLYSDSLTDESIFLLTKKASMEELSILSIRSSRFTEHGLKALRDFKSRKGIKVESPEWRFRPEVLDVKDVPGSKQKADAKEQERREKANLGESASNLQHEIESLKVAITIEEEGAMEIRKILTSRQPHGQERNATNVRPRFHASGTNLQSLIQDRDYLRARLRAADKQIEDYLNILSADSWER